VLVVDDGSSDDTRERALGAGAQVVSHPRNRGVGAAIRSGLEHARAHGFAVAVILSGGGKTPPHQIPALLAPVLSGQADLAQGSRYKTGGRQTDMPGGRLIGTRAYTLLFSLLAGKRVSDASSGFRAVRVGFLDDERVRLQQDWLDRYELEPYLLFQALRYGRVVEVPVHIAYPSPGARGAYTKMRAVTGWWSIFRPVLFLALGLRR
jgi:dolichol-phosphate mannosyltransferase